MLQYEKWKEMRYTQEQVAPLCKLMCLVRAI